MTEFKKLTFNPVHFIFYTVVLLVPEFYMTHPHPWWDGPVAIVENLINYSLLAWIICFIASFLGNNVNSKLEKIVHILFHVLVVSWSFSELFLILGFHRHWDGFTIQLIRETTTVETQGFFEAHLTRSFSIILTLVTILLIILELFAVKRVKRLPLFFAKKSFLYIQIIGSILVLSQIYFFIGNAEENFERAAGLPIKRTAAFNLRQSLLMMKDYEVENNKCADSQKLYDEHPKMDLDVDNIVFIIGESFSKHHSSVYGYNILTNPYLQKRIDNGEGVFYTDVITTTNSTTDNFKLFLSFASSQDSIRWCDTPLLPKVMKEMGWNVVYYSNQFVVESDLGKWDIQMGFLNHPRIAPEIFSERNHRTYEFDMEMLDEYKDKRSELEKADHNFCIFHLYGQHVNFESRYPKSETVFTVDDINRSDLSDSKKQQIAHFDNATRYNDKVVNSILEMYMNKNSLIIYFSDHGEEIYDFRDQLGRSDMAIDVKESFRYQLEVPLFFFVSEECEKKNPNLKERLSKAKDLPFSTDNLPHLILDMINCDSKLLCKEKSPLSEIYKIKRRKLYDIDRYYDEDTNAKLE